MDLFAAPPVVMGHRGAPLRRPENTSASFALAAGEGATWVELDARLTADGTAAVHHDPVLADGTAVIDCDRGRLAGAGVEALETVLDGLAPGLGVDVELKNLPGEPDYDEDDRLVGVVAELLAPRLGTRPFLVSSFNPLSVQRSAEALGCPAGLLFLATLGLGDALEIAAEVGAQVLCPHREVEGLDTAGVEAAHAAGYPVLVWTVDDPEDARRLAAARVDAICTNDPAGIVAALR